MTKLPVIIPLVCCYTFVAISPVGGKTEESQSQRRAREFDADIRKAKDNFRRSGIVAFEGLRVHLYKFSGEMVPTQGADVPRVNHYMKPVALQYGHYASKVTADKRLDPQHAQQIKELIKPCLNGSADDAAKMFKLNPRYGIMLFSDDGDICSWIIIGESVGEAIITENPDLSLDLMDIKSKDGALTKLLDSLFEKQKD